MRLDIIDIADPESINNPNSQRPSSIRFTYVADPASPTPFRTQEFTQNANWPDPTTPAG